MDLGSSQTSWGYKVSFWVRKSLAFAARERLVLGRIELAERSNELVAIPKLLDLLATEGAIVGTDAIGCQRDIGSYTMRVDSRLERVGGTLPLVRQVESLFFALWCSNWSVVQFDSRMHCSVTCHFHG
jgi:predicted transposase YbfD/YdcC